MKILLAHNYYQQAGGEDRVFADEAGLLEGRGHQVLRWTVHNDSIKGRSALAVAAGTVWNAGSARALGELIRREGVAVAHFHNTFPLISPAAYHAARAAGAAVVQTLHNFRLLCPGATLFRAGRVCEECVGRLPLPAVKHGCYRDSKAGSAVVAAMLTAHRALRTYQRAVDAYVALTEFSRRKFIEGGLPADRLFVKPNFVAPAPDVGAGRGGHAVFVGRLSPEKGITTLLEGWARLGGAVPLHILGDGPLAGLVREAAGRDPAVRWLGARPAAEVERAMGDAAFLVLPSVWYEGLPKILVESFSKGTPVVASRLGAMAELVEDGRTGVHFAAGDPAALAAAVRRLRADPAALARMRSEARREYERRYTAAANYGLLLDIYRQALARRAGARSARAETSVGPAGANARLPLPLAGP